MTPERYALLQACLDRRQPDLTVLTENVHKPHNLSAIVRTCDAVGVFRAHAVSADGAVGRHKKTAGGSSRWVELKVHPGLGQAVDELRDGGHQILAAHLSGSAQDFRSVDYTRPTAILMGSELYGVSAEAAALADRHIVIPMAGMVESLNVSVAAALILFEAQRQRRDAGLYDRPRLPADERKRILFEWAYPRVARLCRRRGEPYPELDEDGYLLRSGG